MEIAVAERQETIIEPLELSQLIAETDAIEVTRIPLERAEEGSENKAVGQQGFDQAVATIQAQGGIEAHKNRYGGDVSRCPFINSMGAAGIQLAERLEATEKNPNRGKTIAELLAEKQAEQAANEPLKISVTLTRKETAPDKRQAASDVIGKQELYAALLKEQHAHVISQAEVRREPPPVYEAEEAERTGQLQRPLGVLEALTERAAVIGRQQAKLDRAPTPIPQRQQKQAVPAQAARAMATTKPFAAAQTKQEPVTAKVQLFAPVLHELPRPAPQAKPSRTTEDAPPIEVATPVEQVIPLTVYEAVTDSEQTAEEAIVHTRASVRNDELRLTTDKPLLFEPSHPQLTAFEAIIEHWLEKNAAKDTGADLMGEQPNLPVANTIETIETLEPVTKPIIHSTLEAIHQIIAEVRSYAAGESPSMEAPVLQLEEQCTQLFRLLDAPVDEASVKDIVRDLLATIEVAEWPEQDEVAVEQLHDLGTYEYKAPIASILRIHFLQVIRQRVQRFIYLSRYILSRMRMPATAQHNYG